MRNVWIELHEENFKNTTRLLLRNFNAIRRGYSCNHCEPMHHNPNRKCCIDAQDYVRIVMAGIACLTGTTRFMLKDFELSDDNDIKTLTIRMMKCATFAKRRDIRHVVEIAATAIRIL